MAYTYKIKPLEWHKGTGCWYTYPIVAGSISMDEFGFYKAVLSHEFKLQRFWDLDKAKEWLEEQHTEHVRKYLERI